MSEQTTKKRWGYMTSGDDQGWYLERDDGLKLRYEAAAARLNALEDAVEALEKLLPEAEGWGAMAEQEFGPLGPTSVLDDAHAALEALNRHA